MRREFLAVRSPRVLPVNARILRWEVGGCGGVVGVGVWLGENSARGGPISVENVVEPHSVQLGVGVFAKSNG